MNKKKVIIYDMVMVWCMVGVTLVMLAMTLPIMIHQTPELVVPTIIVLSSIFIVSIVLTLTIGPRSVLTDETITFRYVALGIKQTYQVSAINRFVVDKVHVLGGSGKWDLYLTIFANKTKGTNTKGIILGVGNYALMKLMKRYPTIKVVVYDCCIPYYITLSRRTAKYLVKHKKVAPYMCEQLCEHYHISKKYLADDVNTIPDTNA